MGSRKDFEEMNRYLEEKKVSLKTLLADKQFAFDDARDAYDCLASGNFQGKIVIKV